MPTPLAQPRPDDATLRRQGALQGISALNPAQGQPGVGPQPAAGAPPVASVPDALSQAIQATVAAVNAGEPVEQVVNDWRQALEFLRDLVSQAGGGVQPTPQGPPVGQAPGMVPPAQAPIG